MVTYNILLGVIGLLLIWKRKAINWGHFTVGVVIALLLLGTAIGQPMHDLVQQTASAVQQAINSAINNV